MLGLEPVFELLIEQEKMRVLKQRAVFNLMYAIQQFENNTRIFYSLIGISKTGLQHEFNKNLAKDTKGFVTFNFTFYCELDH